MALKNNPQAFCYAVVESKPPLSIEPVKGEVISSEGEYELADPLELLLGVPELGIDKEGRCTNLAHFLIDGKMPRESAEGLRVVLEKALKNAVENLKNEHEKGEVYGITVHHAVQERLISEGYEVINFDGKEHELKQGSKGLFLFGELQPSRINGKLMERYRCIGLNIR